MAEEARTVSRREFLKIAGIAGATIGAGAGLGGLVAACGGEEETTTTTAAVPGGGESTTTTGAPAEGSTTTVASSVDRGDVMVASWSAGGDRSRSRGAPTSGPGRADPVGLLSRRTGRPGPAATPGAGSSMAVLASKFMCCWRRA